MYMHAIITTLIPLLFSYHNFAQKPGYQSSHGFSAEAFFFNINKRLRGENRVYKSKCGIPCTPAEAAT